MKHCVTVYIRTCNKNVQVVGLNSGEYKQAPEDFREESYSQIYFVDLIYFCLCVAYVILCHRSIKIIT